MKKITFKNQCTKLRLAGTLLLTISSLASCDLNSDTYEPIFIIEPPMDGLMIDDEGIPRRNGVTEISEEMQEQIAHKVVGYGWKWLHTCEIDKHGAVVYQDYYKEHKDARYCNYYFPSATEMTTFSYLDGTNSPGHYDWNIDLNYTNGDVRLNIPDDKYFLLNIMSVFELDGKWYITTIERLGMNGGGLGISQNNFAYSEYIRMTDEELARFQQDYAFSWIYVNE